MSVAPVVHIGGWPGAGKRTIGRIVADRTGGRLIHNHLMLDATRALYARNTPESVAMREEVRTLILSHAARLPAEVPVILTDALAELPEAQPLFEPTVALAQARGAPLRCVVLDLSVDENARRLRDPARLGTSKLTDTAVLSHIRQTDRLFMPPGAQRIDVTEMSADAAAEAVLGHCFDAAPVRQA